MGLQELSLEQEEDVRRASALEAAVLDLEEKAGALALPELEGRYQQLRGEFPSEYTLYGLHSLAASVGGWELCRRPLGADPSR